MTLPVSRFRIPEAHFEPLSQLASLSEQENDALEGVISNTELTRWPGKFIEKVTEAAEGAKGIDPDIAEAVVPVLLSLCRTYQRNDMSLPQFLEAVGNSLRSTEEDGLRPPQDGDWSRLLGRLERLFKASSPISIVARSSRVATDMENTYHSATIYTDLRPVFEAEPSDPPTAVLIVHNMKITYHVRDKLEDIHIALDAEDLNAIRDLLDRAEQKAKSLRDLVEPTSVLVLED